MKREKVFVDNTFTLDWEMEPYVKLASKSNYRLHIVTVENHQGEKNIHAIPDEQICKMAEKCKFSVNGISSLGLPLICLSGKKQ